MTTAMAQITRQDSLLLAEGEETRRRALLKWLTEPKKALTTGQDNLSQNYQKSIAGTEPNAKEGRGGKKKTKKKKNKTQKPHILANGLQRKKKKKAIYCSESTLGTQLHNSIWQLKTEKTTSPRATRIISRHHSHRGNEFRKDSRGHTCHEMAQGDS